jgi:hypothetical protein
MENLTLGGLDPGRRGGHGYDQADAKGKPNRHHRGRAAAPAELTG